MTSILQDIVRRVTVRLTLVDHSDLRLTQARGQVDKLRPPLLARAFAGKLFPQNPADEAAEKLLDRFASLKGKL